jgi:hypothetical protein
LCCRKFDSIHSSSPESLSAPACRASKATCIQIQGWTAGHASVGLQQDMLRSRMQGYRAGAALGQWGGPCSTAG